MKTQYDDIIHLPHHVSKTRPQMSMLDRAAQFSPFAALTGYEDAIQETGRLTDERMETERRRSGTAGQEMALSPRHHIRQTGDHSLHTLSRMRRKPEAPISPCPVLSERWMSLRRILILTDGRKIRLDDIADMEGEVFAPFFRQEEN